ELVFLDEPTAGLDPQSRRATWDIVGELREKGVTTVLTTHFMDEAEFLSDFIHIVDSGKVIASGTPAELSGSGARNTVHFTARHGLDTLSLMAALPHGTKVEEAGPGSYVVTGTVDPELLATLTAWCATHGILAESMLVERQTLEDRFLDLTGRALR
ncbi:MAG: ABC transporter ATP-binding protein, partial [Aeromicrobium sp.]